MAEDNGLKLLIANLGLVNIGSTQTLESFDEQTREAFVARVTIDQVLRATLRKHPWSFATKYVEPAVVGGSASAPINGDWTYAYEYPSDCIFVRRLLPTATSSGGIEVDPVGGTLVSTSLGMGREFNDNPIKFRVGREGDALVVYASVTDVAIEYTAIFDCPVELADSLFIEAASWMMASKYASGLARSEKKPLECLQLFQLALNSAATVDMRENQQPKPGEAEWIRAR